MSVCSCWLLIWYDCGGVRREWFAKTQLILTCLNLTRPAIWQPPNVIMRSQVWVMKTTSRRLLKCRVELRAINPYDTALSWTSCIARAYSIKRKCGFYDLHFYHPTTSTRSLHNRLQPFLFCLLSIISCKHLMKIKIECSDYSIYRSWNMSTLLTCIATVYSAIAKQGNENPRNKSKVYEIS